MTWIRNIALGYAALIAGCTVIILIGNWILDKGEPDDLDAEAAALYEAGIPDEWP